MTEPPPPPRIALFVEVLGLEATLMLLEKRGGTQFWVPTGVGTTSKKLRDDMEAEFSPAIVKALIATFGGAEITVPLCHEWRTALYAARGLARAEIARRLCCHIKTVHRRLAALRVPAEDRQSAWRF